MKNKPINSMIFKGLERKPVKAGERKVCSVGSFLRHIIYTQVYMCMCNAYVYTHVTVYNIYVQNVPHTGGAAEYRSIPDYSSGGKQEKVGY